MNATSTQGMRRLEGGSFVMGSDHHYPEEAPARPAVVLPFWIDAHLVTNAGFARFVAQTGHVTDAERVGGSLLFCAPRGLVDLRDPAGWWEFREGACWRQPLGPQSDLGGLEYHPVVHVTAGDAEAYAHWAGKSLPTEAEWEFAARGGLAEAVYAWGDELAPGGAMLANYWQGEFPWRNTCEDGYERTSPVGAFAPNGYGLHDMIGNVWEWTADAYEVTRSESGAKACCSPAPDASVGRRVIKGGSHLCAPNYCSRYRPAARSPQDADSSTSHVGFRCVRREQG